MLVSCFSLIILIHFFLIIFPCLQLPDTLKSLTIILKITLIQNSKKMLQLMLDRSAVRECQPVIICKQFITRVSSYKHHRVHIHDTVSKITYDEMFWVKAESAADVQKSMKIFIMQPCQTKTALYGRMWLFVKLSTFAVRHALM